MSTHSRTARTHRRTLIAAACGVLALSAVATVVGTRQEAPTVGAAGSQSSSSEAARSRQRVASDCNPLPFEPASAAELRSSPKKAFAFYFPPFPISIDNRDPSKDYYATWLARTDPAGYKLVDRPLIRPISGDPNWLQRDYETEVRQARAAGLDGFIYEYNDATADVRFKRLPLLLAAARAVDPNFRIMLSPDFPTAAGASPDSTIKAIAKVADEPNLFRLADGRLVLAPFAPERQPSAFWTAVRTQLAAQGVTNAYVPIFGFGGTSSLKDYAPQTYGFSTWGTRYPSATSAYVAGAKASRALDRIYMSPVAFEDVRSASGQYYEAGNSSELRASFTAAIQGQADWIDLTTWNDYTESWMAPSANRGYAVTDLSAYYVNWFKTGQAPEITKDVLYWFHREQRTDAPVRGLSSVGTTAKLMGTDPASNQVELLAFLKTPGRLTITQGSDVRTMDAPAGLTSFKAPLVPGTTPGFTLERSGRTAVSMTSNAPVQTQVDIPDLTYHAGSSTTCARP